MEPIHRDDIDADLAAEIERRVAETHPGFKVVFAGDAPGGASPAMLAAMAAIQATADESLVNGTCIDCGKKMLDYRPDDDDWNKPKGWGYFSHGEEFGGWQCPECDAQEQDGQPRPI